MTIWTTIEPCIGIICACLPTLRPLLSATWFEVKHYGSKVRNATVRSNHDQAIQLESGKGRPQDPQAGFHTKWLDNELDAPSSETVAGGTAFTKVVGCSDPERDDIPLKEINVQQEVHVDRNPRWTT